MLRATIESSPGSHWVWCCSLYFF